MANAVPDEVPGPEDAACVVGVGAVGIRLSPRIEGEPRNARVRLVDLQASFGSDGEAQRRITSGDAVKGAIHVAGVPLLILQYELSGHVFDRSLASQSPVSRAVDDANHAEARGSRFDAEAGSREIHRDDCADDRRLLEPILL